MEASPWGLIDIARIADLRGSGDRGVARVASEQHGLVTTAQLRFLGLTLDAISYRVAMGRLHARHRGVYLVGHEAIPPLAPFAAAVLACGPGSVISHRSAASIWKLLLVGDLVHVLSLAQRRNRAGIRAHRTGHLERWEIQSFERIPVTSPVRTIVDLAETESLADVESALNAGRGRRLFTQRDFQSTIDRAAGRHSFGYLSALMERETGGDFSRSVAEDLLARYILAARLPSPRRNFRAYGFELDFYWPELMLDVEVDGVTWHSTRDQVNRDHERDVKLVAAGVQVLRFTWDQLQREAETIARLAAAITIAEQRRRR
jgi:very-short-patch-repair endonuclease